MFLLVSCSFAFQYLFCFVRNQSQRTKEIENKKHITKNCQEHGHGLFNIKQCSFATFITVGSHSNTYKSRLKARTMEDLIALSNFVVDLTNAEKFHASATGLCTL